MFSNVIKYFIMQIMFSFMAGCSWLPVKTQYVTIEDPYCVAIKTIPYKSTVKPLNTKKYQNIKVSAKDLNGVRVVSLEVQDFESLVAILTDVEGALVSRELELKAFEAYYDPKKFTKQEKKK